MKTALTLMVNGREREVYADPTETLLSVLRERLALTGTKEGCGDGECGACVVIVDGESRNACLTLVGEVEGAQILTVEGLMADGRLDPLQEAFIAHGAVQCGFCTPGLLMSARALLDRSPDPTEAEIRTAIAGNLCRCTGYVKVVEAIRSAASREIPEECSTCSPGSPVFRADGLEKVTGRAVFGADVSLPGQLWGAVARSTRAHARILAVDASAALALPGVEAVVTGAEVPAGYYGVDLYDQQVLAREKVRWIGEPLALVAADTKELAYRAAALIHVTYEDLPPVYDLDAALAEGAARVHEDLERYGAGWDAVRYGNVCSESVMRRGDCAGAIADAEHVFTHEYETQIVHQSYIEPHASLAMAEPSGKVTIWTTNQKPFAVRHYMAGALGWPMTRIRVFGLHIGGGFGGKLEMGLEPYCALLALKSGRPVKMTMTRGEEFVGANPRHASRIRITSAVTAEGRLTGRRAEILMDTGAYSGNGPTATSLAMLLVVGPYRIDNVELIGRCVYTNKASSGSCRGPGGPQAVFAMESHLDEIARALGLDPLQFRLNNLVEEGDLSATGQVLEDVSIRECLLAAAEEIGYGEPLGPDEGVGLACSWWTSGGWATSAQVNLNEDGTVTLVTGSVDIGPGAKYSSIPQIVAEELGLHVHQVILSSCDTDISPYDHGDGGSRMTFSVGRVAQLAAEDARRRILARAAAMLDEPLDDLTVGGGAVIRASDGSRLVSFGEIAERGRRADGPIVGQATYLAETPPYDPATVTGVTYPAFIAPSFSAHAARVAVDRSTGKIAVRRVVAAQDVGKAINPLAVEGQIEGGVAMGLGYALLEETVMEEGRVLNPGFLDYKLLTSVDVPDVLPVIVEKPSRAGPFGAKGVGEPPASLPAAAVANALADAVGVRLRRLPLRPEDVLAALDAQVQEGGAAR